MESNFIVPGLADPTKPADVSVLAANGDAGMVTFFVKDIQQWRKRGLAQNDELHLVIALYSAVTGIQLDTDILPGHIGTIFDAKIHGMKTQLKNSIVKARNGKIGGQKTQKQRRIECQVNLMSPNGQANVQANVQANGQANVQANGQANVQAKRKPTSTSTSTSASSDHNLHSKEREFISPPLDEVRELFKDEFPKLDPMTFYNYYESTGWQRNNGTPIVDWQAAARVWAKRETNIGAPRIASCPAANATASKLPPGLDRCGALDVA